MVELVGGNQMDPISFDRAVKAGLNNGYLVATLKPVEICRGNRERRNSISMALNKLN